MPPNPKYPKSMHHLTVTETPLKSNGIPDHAAPLATSADVIPTQGVPTDGGKASSSHQDVEAQSTSSTNETRYVHHGHNHEDNNHDEETRIVRTILRKYSSIVQDPEQFTVDTRRLQHALKDAGTYVYGIQAISVWIFDEDHDHLVIPPGGFWYHPTTNTSNEALEALVAMVESDDIPIAAPVSPGTDLAGLLWLEASNHPNPHRQHPRESSFAQHAPTRQAMDDPSAFHRNHCTASLTWRDLKSLVQDPDVAKGQYLPLMEEAGFGHATGIPFNTGVCRGMVIFLVQDGLDSDILQSHIHTTYVRQAAQFIGTAAAMTEARRATIGQQIEKRKSMDGDDDIRQVEDEPIEERKHDLDKAISKKERHSQPRSNCPLVPKRVQVCLTKIQGGGLQIPPPLSLRQSLWTAVGCFCGLLVLSALNEYYMMLSEKEYFLLLGPFGALMTLQYGLTAAPASQPRNAVLGQAVAGAISLAFTYIPEYILATWLRRAVGPAIAIAAMVKLGLTHPPAGAHAVLYASGQYNFVFYALVVLSTVVSIIPATLVNNMSHKRQYPTYWGFP